uniref:Uncharacterized protein n=1 Tax=Anguilla anguilla TaxID=7936 RepID=A0A0E9PRH7_ANGAN
MEKPKCIKIPFNKSL